MSILGFTDFETGDLLEGAATTGSVAISTTQVHSGTYALRCNPATTGLGAYELGYIYNYTVGLGTAAVAALAFSAAGEVYFRLYLYINALPTANEEIFQGVKSGGSTASADYALQLTSAGAIAIFANGTQVATTGSGAVSTGTWHLLQFKLSMGTSGPYELQIDSTSVLSGTATFGTTFFTQFWLGKNHNANGSGYDCYFDDVAFSITAYPPAANGTLLVPTGPGTTNQWTGSFSNVDTVPPSGGSPLTDGTAGTNDVAEFTMTSPATAGIPSTATINAVKIIAYAKSASSGSASLQVGANVAATIYHSVTATLPASGAYAPYGLVFDVNPATSAAWTFSDLGSIQASLENTASVGIDAEAVYLMVDWTPTPYTGPSPQTIVSQLADFYYRNRD